MTPRIGDQLAVATDGLRQRALQATLALDHARQALDSRRVIGMATGLLMQQYQLTEEAALEALRRRATSANLSLREVAAEMVDDADDAGNRLPPPADC